MSLPALDGGCDCRGLLGHSGLAGTSSTTLFRLELGLDNLGLSRHAHRPVILDPLAAVVSATSSCCRLLLTLSSGAPLSVLASGSASTTTASTPLLGIGVVAGTSSVATSPAAASTTSTADHLDLHADLVANYPAGGLNLFWGSLDVEILLRRIVL